VETVQSLLAGGIAFNTPEKEMGRPSRPVTATRCMPRRRKSGRSGAPHPALISPLTHVHPSPALCRARLPAALSEYSYPCDKMSPLFFGQRDCTVHDNTYLPDHFLRHIAAIMPAHLSMDEFVASCRRPLRRSIQVNTLKISVAGL
jgi:16S rRNA (cytosine1407-C5)-methyltransferase